MFRYVLAWIPMLVIAVANGAFRQLTFGKVMSEPHAHQLSTLIGSFWIGAFIWLVVHTWPPSSGRQALLVGVVWVLLTVAFETFMGLVLQHRPIQDVLYENNLSAGRVWTLFLIWLGVAPWSFFHIRQGQNAAYPSSQPGRCAIKPRRA